MPYRSLLCVVLVSITAMPFGGCKEPLTTNDMNQLVIQAYLYAGRPVTDVYVSASFAIGSTDTAGPPVTAATVRLTREGTSYALSAVTDRPGYYHYAGSDLAIRTGDVFSLDVQWGSHHATATTVVPGPPADIGVSAETLRVSVETGFGGMQRIVSSDSCVVRWTGSDNDLFFVVMENVDSNPVEISSSAPPGMFGMGMPSQPMPQTTYRIRTEGLRQTGRHSVRVYRVNKEYADLYRSRAQDTRSLNEPLTNIHNGLGVFSAFASDSVAVTVLLE